MKITRHRRVRRTLNFYKNNHGFRTPYQILIDATFCQEALKSKVNIQEQMPKYLESVVKLKTTVCVITEAASLGSSAYGASLIVKQYKTVKCGHEKDPIAASECLSSVISQNKDEHYLIATQDSELSRKIRDIPGIPLLYIKYNAIILEKPPEFKSKASEKSDSVVDYHMSVVKDLKRKAFGEEEVKTKKKRKMKGANPLSCKKKQSKPAPTQDAVKVRSRNRHKRNLKTININHKLCA